MTPQWSRYKSERVNIDRTTSPNSLTREDTTLNGAAIGDSFIGVDTLEGSFQSTP